jgi:hypothetical protein
MDRKPYTTPELDDLGAMADVTEVAGSSGNLMVPPTGLEPADDLVGDVTQQFPVEVPPINAPSLPKKPF